MEGPSLIPGNLDVKRPFPPPPIPSAVPAAVRKQIDALAALEEAARKAGSEAYTARGAAKRMDADNPELEATAAFGEERAKDAARIRREVQAATVELAESLADATDVVDKAREAKREIIARAQSASEDLVSALAELDDAEQHFFWSRCVTNSIRPHGRVPKMKTGISSKNGDHQTAGYLAGEVASALKTLKG
jgi:hypothetical protein